MGKPMVYIFGGSGFVGRKIVSVLSAAGFAVKIVSRQPGHDVCWNGRDPIDFFPSSGEYAVINAAGESIAGGRWTSKRKELLRASRVTLTERINAGLSKHTNPPILWINFSAVGYYGERGAEDLDESAALGKGFLAELCATWERAATG